MDQLLTNSLYAAIGLFSGFMSGMLGIGGGSLRVPLLNLAGMPLISAFGINLFVIPFSSAIGALTHRKNIDKKIGLYLIIGGSIGSIGGAMLTGIFSKITLAIIFVIISIITVFGIYLYKIMPGLSSKLKPKFLNVSIGAALLNLITGMRGGSGGSLFPPFIKALGLDIHKAIATSLLVTIFTALSGLAVYLGRGDLALIPALIVTAGSMIGARLGSKLSMKTKTKSLELLLSVLVILFSFVVVYKA
ncbi:MAG: sulfite exporter TauE/SafE family protein, partial [Spirochaetaceae bacterium]|nr:sulfite exporter TauE/SafE family protein [Spirochaetaceae bacterium]